MLVNYKKLLFQQFYLKLVNRISNFSPWLNAPLYSLNRNELCLFQMLQQFFSEMTLMELQGFAHLLYQNVAPEILALTLKNNTNVNFYR